MGKLYTRWGRELLQKLNTKPDILPNARQTVPYPEGETEVLSLYPRPSMVRGHYQSLNGKWDYCIEKQAALPNDSKREEASATEFQGKILVPFSPESPLSGVERQLQPDEVLRYRRFFELPVISGSRLLLHFGAVDAEAEVFVNGLKAGAHVGGYLPFTLDITGLVQSGTNELEVQVTDPSDTSYHARGKQKLKAAGMFYTAVSGIWQTVWLEEVPEQYIADLRAVPDIDAGEVKITVFAGGSPEIDVPALPVRITVYAPDVYREEYLADAEDSAKMRRAALVSSEGISGQEIRIRIPEPEYWTPEEPRLYTYTVEAGADAVDSYFSMRSFTIEQRNGFQRVCLNHEEIFLEGVLDQGYWPDGIYTAPADEALIFDIEEMKKMGFNMLRKHMKIESERWYYHCDRLGMIVCQDMVFGGGRLHSSLNTWLPTALEQLPLRPTLPDGPAVRWITARRDKEGRKEFEKEMKDTIRFLYNHPSIAIWCIFNESWGQFDAKRLTEEVRSLDPTRLIDSVSGWFDQRCGDFQSIHHYFFRLNYRKKDPRALFLSEYGGYPWEIPDHLWGKGGYGYGKFRSPEELNRAYRQLIAETRALREKGFCGSVYTQVSDVEDEVNGIFTYDREVKKIERNE